ncbi:HlyD family secretion protein [Dawidia soli]|uniref:HlyD family efflux transporter periplasmic adaptor subunit n=1 Tax=Dawidia soli TaxID=2782352 RepID=A0AAP2DDC9_9BACT|nr:HlyD family efflux transporter periplasmic adaptor subunit [Dawidia soli]MBT1689267.1 HlyD family efflux transporter periplasmic adaptor subunit [Dawidia soli]
MKHIAYCLFVLVVLGACRRGGPSYDASGTFEAVETIVSAEVTGTLLVFQPDEGDTLRAGELVGVIDSIPLYLKKKQLEAQVQSVLANRPDVARQLAAVREQLRHAEREQQRLSSLVQAGAATQKQYDDAAAQTEVLRRQLEAQQSTLSVTNSSLAAQTAPLIVQVQQVEDQLTRCRIINAVKGTVLTTYAEPHEMAVAGKPLYKVADLTTLTLRAYITGDQLTVLRLQQPVTVVVDAPDGVTRTYPGVVTWISDQAEFTPKTIQTKAERANLVYAVKIRVRNDGYLKIGMYGEVTL